MDILTDEQLLEMIDFGQSDRVEFQESLSGNAPTAIREAVCAFANDLPDHKQPGYIVVGVDNDKTIVGFPDNGDLWQQLVDIQSDSDLIPTPSLTVDKYVLTGKEVAVIKVDPDSSPPVRYQGITHVRASLFTRTALEGDMTILYKKGPYRHFPFDANPLPSSSIDDIDLNLYNQYLSQAFSSYALEMDPRSLEEKLIATRMVFYTEEPPATFPATVLGILVFGKHPQKFMPNSYINFRRVDDSSGVEGIVEETNIQGTIPELLNLIEEKLQNYNRVSFDASSDTKEIYPFKVLQGLVRNAVIHRQYDNTREPVKVSWYNDRIEIMNPGGPYGMHIYDFGKTGIVEFRNPNIARVMKALGFATCFGIGISLSNRLLEEAGHPALEYEVKHDKIKVTVKPVKHTRDHIV